VWVGGGGCKVNGSRGWKMLVSHEAIQWEAGPVKGKAVEVDVMRPETREMLVRVCLHDTAGRLMQGVVEVVKRGVSVLTPWYGQVKMRRWECRKSE
jgi:hypothetical protein